MPARRRPGRRAPTPEPIDTDLAGLTRLIDTWVGGSTAFADAVTGYRHGRDLSTALTTDARRDELRRRCAAALANGVATDGRRVIVPQHRPDRVVRRPTSEAVRRASPALWEASRLRGVTLAITAPADRVVVPSKLVTPTAELLIRTLVNEGKAIRTAKALERDGRDRLRAVIEAVSPLGVWGGEQWVTADGWAIGWASNVRFNSAVAAALAPTHGIEVADISEDALVKGTTWYVAREVGSDAGDEGDPYSE